MNKRIERFNKHLLDAVDGVNSFESEMVQSKVIEYVLWQFDIAMITDVHPPMLPKKGKKPIQPPDISKIINLLLRSNFFNKPRSISAITTYANENYNGTYDTYFTADSVLRLVKEKKLIRIKSEETNQYVYLKNQSF